MEDIVLQFLGTNEHEGNVFVFSAFGFRLPKPMYQFIVLSFFREAALGVLRLYSQLAKRSSHDYRIALSAIINDYLFRCPNQLFAHLLTTSGSQVHLYEFSLATKTPGYSMCDGLACHTAELPFVFNHLDIIEEEYSWPWDKQVFEDAIRKPVQTIFSNVSEVFEKTEQRSLINAKVSRLLADFWTNFAKYGDPNGMASANGYHVGTRIDEAPWWPRLLGELPSTEAIKEIEAFYLQDLSSDKRRMSRDGKSPSSSRLDQLLNRAAPPMVKGGKFVHLLNFDSTTEMRIVERDCVCEFWNKLNYRF